MRTQIKRLLALAMAVCLTVPVGLTALAAKEPSYEVRVSGGKIQLATDQEVTDTYAYKKSTLTLTQQKSGALAIKYPEKATGKTVLAPLDAKTKLNFRGGMSSLTVDNTVTKGKTITVSGQVLTLTIAAPVKVVLTDSANVSKLRVTSRSASVDVADGAEVKDAVEARAGSISGESATLLTETTSGYREPVYLEIEDDDDQKYTRSVSYETGSKNVLTLEAKNGVSLSRAMKDVKLTVYRESNDKKVYGKWAWTSGDSSTTKSGTYTYQFTPSDTAMAPVTLKVEYTGTGTTGKYSKPSLKFASGQRSHGAANTSVQIAVGVPKQAEDDDELIIYLGNKEVNRYSLSESDAGETQDFSVDIGDGSSGDVFKIKVKIKRSYGGASAASSVLKYEID